MAWLTQRKIFKEWQQLLNNLLNSLQHHGWNSEECRESGNLYGCKLDLKKKKQSWGVGLNSFIILLPCHLLSALKCLHCLYLLMSFGRQPHNISIIIVVPVHLPPLHSPPHTSCFMKGIPLIFLCTCLWVIFILFCDLDFFSAFLLTQVLT